MRRCLRDPMFSRFDTIPECDRQTHTHTHTDTRRRHIPRLARRCAVINELSINKQVTNAHVEQYRVNIDHKK